MRWLVLAACLFLAGCYNPQSFAAPTGGEGEWTYVKGPHGENCLLLSRFLGGQSGVLAMDCDTVKP